MEILNTTKVLPINGKDYTFSIVINANEVVISTPTPVSTPITPILSPSNKYVWCYQLTKDSNANIIAKLKNNGITDIFLSTDVSKLTTLGYINTTLDFYNQCKINNIRIHALIIDENDCYLTATHQIALTKVDKYVTFLIANPTKIDAVVGIHIDVEPYTQLDWTDITKDGILVQYQDMLSKIYSKITTHTNLKVASLLVSPSIPSWYDSSYTSGTLPHGNINLFKPISHFIAVMAYFDTSTGTLISKTSSEISKISGEVNIMPTVCGINVSEYNSMIEGQQVATSLYNTYKTNPNYCGIAFFQYTNLI